MRFRIVARLLGSVALAASVTAGLAPTARATRSAAKIVPMPVHIDTLLVDASSPRTVYVAGSFGLMRSSDAGQSWADLGHDLGLGETYLGHQDSYDTGSPFVTSGFGVGGFSLGARGTLFAQESGGSGTPDSNSSRLLRSGDGGLTWKIAANLLGSGEILYDLKPSPADPMRYYAIAVNQGGWVISTSTDDGRTWPGGTMLPDDQNEGFNALLPDAAHSGTVYVQPRKGAWLRSENSGAAWTAVASPAALPAASVILYTDTHLPGMLVARVSSPSLPADRRFVSSDAGRTWQTARCPGALAGACPLFAIDNVFGAGAAYAFHAGGVYAFQGGGAAGKRLAVSDTLPLPITQIAQVAGGSAAGDPVYLLGKTAHGVPGGLFASTDGGAHWRPIITNLLPNEAPAAAAPGTLPVRATHHSVAAPFVAMYRKLGVAVIGLPVTEAYLQGTVLTQDFEHLRLQVKNGAAAIAPLGVDVFFYGVTPEQPNPAPAYGYYDPHNIYPTLAPPHGVFAQFWRAHGGTAVFGLPITKEFSSPNLDGRHRSYTMQYFTNARLELHPENKNPRYRIQLGLLGPESLLGRGWTTIKK